MKLPIEMLAGREDDDGTAPQVERSRSARGTRSSLGEHRSSAVRGSTPSDQLLFTVIETAVSLQLSRSKVYELLYSGSLPSVKIGNSRRIRRGDLEQFVRNLDDGS